MICNQIYYIYNNRYNKHRDVNTWHVLHNDGQWIVFECEWVILSKEINSRGHKQQKQHKTV